MKTTPEQLAQYEVLAEEKAGTDTGDALRALIDGLIDARKIIQQEQEVSIGTDDLLKGRISFLESELAATRKQLEEAQAKLAAAEKNEARWNAFLSMNYEDRMAYVGNASLVPVFISWIDAAIAAQEGKR